MAPDQSSLNAARKLLVDGQWPSLERDAEHRFLWGACQGSGASAYRVVVEIEDLGAKCTCPSRKFPCKHSLALMWWFAERPDRFQEGSVPEWVTEWQGRRRRTGAQDAAASSGPPKSARAAAADAVADAAPRDADASARQKERNRAAREASVAQGLDELDVWIGDQIDRGLGTFGARAAEQCRLLARRLVDAKAGGLANRLDHLPALYFGTPEARRHDVLLEQLGGLHLLAQAYRRQSQLGEALVSDVRSGVGWTMTREELLTGAGTLRHRARWTVLATRRELQPDSLVRFETFLAARDASDAGGAPGPGGGGRSGASGPGGPGEIRMALLLDFAPAAVAAGAGPGLVAGTELDAELAYYPSATPLRAVVAAQHSSGLAAQAPQPTDDLEAAIDRYDSLLAVNPWIASWPIAFHGVRVELAQGGECWAVDRDGKRGVPLAGEEAHVLLDLDELALYGTFDGRELTPLAASSPLGPFWSSHA